MTSEQLSHALNTRVTYTARNREMILHTQIVLWVIAAVFIALSVAGVAEMNPSTWGARAYALPAWAWGILNLAASSIAAWGLIQPPKPRWIAFGATMHVLQFSAIGMSAALSGGDYGVSIWAGGLMALHAKVALEAMRETPCRWKRS